MKLNSVKLGLAGGILWALMLFVMTWLAMYTNYGMLWLVQWTDIYPGYDFTPVGSLLGLIYGFIDGFICLFLLGWIYNLLKP